MEDDGTNLGLERTQYQLRSTGLRGEPNNKLRSGIHNRGYLPHVKREGASYFVTFRLADSLPREMLMQFEQERATARRTAGNDRERFQKADLDFQRKIERYLDTGVGECHLQNPKIASMAVEALLFFHDKQYALRDWVIMPNHIHIVLWPMPGRTLTEILRSRKRHIARQANIILGRTGETFWQHESYDHWIRNDDESARICRYVRNNPVTARLCAKPEDWLWSSARRS